MTADNVSGIKTVSPSRTIYGSYDWLRFGQGVTDRHAMSATISSSVRLVRLVLEIAHTRGGAITNDWRRSMATAVVCNRATRGCDHRPIVRIIIVSDDRSYDQSWCRVTDRTINRDSKNLVRNRVVGPGFRGRANVGTGASISHG